MRVKTHIFSVSFVLLFAFLHIHPLLAAYEVKNLRNEVKKEKACAKSKKQGCAKSKCPKQKEKTQEEKDKCKDTGCNPFVPCSMGYCCYLVENFYSYTSASLVKKQKIALIDDNRLLNKLSECWHPPELLS
jgi:hypothetical protein